MRRMGHHRKKVNCPTILIGAPVFKRDWVLPYWMEAIERQNFPKENLGFVFELGPDDDATHDLLWEWQAKHPEFIVYQGDIQMELPHREHTEGKRHWSPTRYMTMASLRNSLLDKATVHQHKFDYYFSLDSDIMLQDPETLNILTSYGEIYKNTVFSPLSYMKPHDAKDWRNYPSIMTWKDAPGFRASRDMDNYPIGEAFFADIVMAAVLMPREIFTKVRYRAHKQGEDLGFAAELHRSGYRSMAISNVKCPHIMHKYMLPEYISETDTQVKSEIYIS